jgi:hypothetical protein
MVIAGEVLSDEEGDGGGQQDGDDWLRGLEARAREHLAQRLAPTSRRKLATVMRHLRRLQRRLLGKRRLFKVPRRSGDMAALLHNEWSLVIFAEFLALRKGRGGKGRIAIDTVAEYVSMAKQELSVQFGFALAGVPHRLPQVIKAMRRQRPRQQRQQRRGIRRAHLRAARRRRPELTAGTADGGRPSADAANRWAAATSAWAAVARGGEVATPRADLPRWSGASRPTRADLSFHRRGRTRYACLMLAPIKRTNGELGEKVPILIAEGDGGGDDAFTALQTMVAVDPCPAKAAASTPLFREGGRPLTTESLRAYAKRIWRAAGQHGRVAGHSFRIGGITDLADQGASQSLLQAKGRWASDVYRIYTRMTRRAQLAASQAMQRRGGRDMEELFPSFTQGV